RRRSGGDRRARAEGARRPAVNLRRRHARMGARPRRALSGGARVVPARSPPRHPGLAAGLPSRLHRALSRTSRGGEGMVQPGACAQPRLLDQMEPTGRAVGTVMKRLLFVGALLAVLAAVFLPGSASAHPLGNFTINRSAAVQLSGNRLYVSYV